MNGQSKWAVAVSAGLVLGMQAMGQATKAPVQEGTVEASGTKRVIIVSLEDRKLALVEDGQVKKVYTVAIGKPSTPSPEGTFTVVRRVKNPVYQHEGKTIQPGPHNPVGTRWMGLSIKGYGIHGTNEPNSIGKAASHGCIRMAKKDLEEMYEMVSVGDAVELVGRRNEETAELFGEQKPAPSAGQPAPNADQPVLTATSAPASAATQTDAVSTVDSGEGVSVTGNW